MSKIVTSAREAIRIAESYFPTDLRRQENLAKDIVEAIERCELELGLDIMRRVKGPAISSTHQSAPAVLISLPSGESDPGVSPDCAGADTAISSTDKSGAA